MGRLGWFENTLDAGVFRRFSIGFALTYLIYFLAWMTDGVEWLTAEGYHYSPASNGWYNLPPFPLLQPWMLVPFSLITVAGFIAIAMNRFQRIGWVVLFGSAFYIQNADPVSAFTMNKLYVVFFALFAISHLPAKGQQKMMRYPLELVKWTFLIHYMNAGIAKMAHGDWLVHADVMWSQAQGHYRNWLSAWTLNALPAWVYSILMYLFLVFETTAIIGLNWTKTRRWYVFIGLGGHLIIALLMDQLIYFSLQMASFYLVLLDDQTWEKWHSKLSFLPFFAARTS